MSNWHIVRAFSLTPAGIAVIYASIVREQLVSELKACREIRPSDFPVHIPLLLERAHRFYFPDSARRTRFRSAYLVAVLAGSVAALSTIFIDFGF